MKKLILSFSAICFAAAAIAQISITPYNSSSDISGTTQNIEVDPMEASGTFVKFHVVNNSGVTKNLVVRRTLLTALPYTSTSQRWDDQVCWGTVGDPFGQCYDSDGTTWTLLPQNALEVEQGEEVELKPQILPFGEQTGSAHIRYYVMEGSTLLDSIDVQWSSEVLSVKEEEQVNISVYPNPTASMLTVSPGSFEGTYLIRMTDVLGKVIYDERTSGTKKIDVSDFKNGVYLVTIFDKGVAVQTKRVVVKH